MADHDFGSIWTVLATTRVPDESELVVSPAGALADGREVLAGLDSNGDRHVLVPLLASEQFAGLGKGRPLQLRAVELPAGRYASAVCTDRKLDEVFGQFARELMDAVMKSGKPGRDMRLGYESWRSLFSEEPAEGLTREQEVGLLGELLLLRDILMAGGRCEMWKGPNGASHDFRAGPRHIEVKTTLTREGLFIPIHGVAQLEVPTAEVLHLFVYRLEESAAGSSLTSLVDQIETEIDDPQLFRFQLRLAGYRSEQSGLYQTVFRVVDALAFDTHESDFPKIISSSFVGGQLPPGTMKLAYVVDLSGPSPSPLSVDVRQDVILKIGRN